MVPSTKCSCRNFLPTIQLFSRGEKLYSGQKVPAGTLCRWYHLQSVPAGTFCPLYSFSPGDARTTPAAIHPVCRFYALAARKAAKRCAQQATGLLEKAIVQCIHISRTTNRPTASLSTNISRETAVFLTLARANRKYQGAGTLRGCDVIHDPGHSFLCAALPL